MPGLLTEYLEDGFVKHPPPGWTCRREGNILTRKDAGFLGYAPRADVVMEDGTSGRRIWIEFEVSRADPVANHAKFATARHLGYLKSNDIFLSMVSAHVARGRRNLASNMIGVMRRLGLDAFQTVLLPKVDGPGIFELNHMEKDLLQRSGPDVRPEVGRAIGVCSPVLERGGHRVHFASDPFQLMLSLLQWNREVITEEGGRLWGKRRIQYFVHNPVSGHFAPCKFCAFVPFIQLSTPCGPPAATDMMTLDLYTQLDESETRFDGRIAWKHLVEHLGFSLESDESSRTLMFAFEKWHTRFSNLIHTTGEQIQFCLPPGWYLPSSTQTK